MKVIVRGRVSVYEANGQYQLYAEEMQPDGVGALALAFEQRKEKLAAEGLFDPAHKRALPRYPMRIGVVTSPTGAAIRDILQILCRRWPTAQVVLAPVLVQGSGAPEQMIRAIEEMNRTKAADLLIVGRGGGSAEDLSAFNDEALARAVYASGIPVISAVGHETDFTICDFVADLRAPTPSAAAELAVPDRTEVAAELASLSARMQNAVWDGLEGRREALDILRSSGILQTPKAVTGERRAALCALTQRIGRAAEKRTASDRETLTGISARLDAMSPLKTLARGYAALTDPSGRPVHRVREVGVGDALRAVLSDGTLKLSVLEINRVSEKGETDGKEKADI